MRTAIEAWTELQLACDCVQKPKLSKLCWLVKLVVCVPEEAERRGMVRLIGFAIEAEGGGWGKGDSSSPLSQAELRHHAERGAPGAQCQRLGISRA